MELTRQQQQIVAHNHGLATDDSPDAPIEQVLIEASIPYQIAVEEPFFRHREIVDLLNYPELAAFGAALRSEQQFDRATGERFVACWRSLYNRPKRYLNHQFFQETVHAVLQQGRPLS
jgi:DNA helicase-2/ATP-dependent DNA helicase PcrA